jgi:hypothetical protein
LREAIRTPGKLKEFNHIPFLGQNRGDDKRKPALLFRVAGLES